MGWTLYTQVEESPVSKWAEQNSLPGVYPVQYGWSVVTSTRSRWFDSPMIACGGFGIPGRIQRGEIMVDGLTQEETLQRYQAELIAAFNEHGSTLGVQRKWSQNKK
jgi:hypothetical protein